MKDQEFTGFVTYLISFLLLGVYLAWSYLPDDVLHSIGVYYYSQRYWALAVPLHIIVSIGVVVAVTISMLYYKNPGLSHHTCLTDDDALVQYEDVFTAESPVRDDLRILTPLPQLRSAQVFDSNSDSSSSSQLSGGAEGRDEGPIAELADIPMAIVNKCMKW